MRKTKANARRASSRGNVERCLTEENSTLREGGKCTSRPGVGGTGAARSLDYSQSKRKGVILGKTEDRPGEKTESNERGERPEDAAPPRLRGRVSEKVRLDLAGLWKLSVPRRRNRTGLAVGSS